MTEARTRPIKATIVSDITKARTIPGAYKYFSDGTTIGPTGMTIICPCGCGAIQPLHFKPGPSPSWKWNAADAPAQRAPQGALAWPAAPRHLGEPLTLAARSGPTSRTAPRPDALPDHHGGPDRVQGETDDLENGVHLLGSSARAQFAFQSSRHSK
jgi:Family of unknown function (DUF6527)